MLAGDWYMMYRLYQMGYGSFKMYPTLQDITVTVANLPSGVIDANIKVNNLTPATQWIIKVHLITIH